MPAATWALQPVLALRLSILPNVGKAGVHHVQRDRDPDTGTELSGRGCQARRMKFYLAINGRPSFALRFGRGAAIRSDNRSALFKCKIAIKKIF